MIRVLGAMLLLALALTACDDAGPGVSTSSPATTAEISMHPWVRPASGPDAETRDDGNKIVRAPDEEGGWVEVGPAALGGADVDSAKATTSPNSVEPVISVSFTENGARSFQALTAQVSCEPPPANRIVIVVDDEVLSAPVVSVPCGDGIQGGGTDIQGDFTMDEAKALAKSIDLGR